MADLSTQMKCVLHLNHERGGWSETYFLKTNSYPDARSVASLIANYRRSFMAWGVQLVWGRVSFLGKPRERQGLEGLPLDPLPQVAKQLLVNDLSTALHYAFESDTGRWGNRLIRGIPDEWISNYRLNMAFPEPLAVGAALSDPLAGGSSLLRIQQSFLRYLITNTSHVRITAKGPPPLGDIEAWSRCIPRRVGSRKTGRPFGLSRGRA